MIKSNLNFHGIYQIINEIDNKIYIGSAVNVWKRWWEHKKNLNNNSHQNIYLQNSYNKYGKNNFTFELLQKVEKKEDLIFYEQKWLDLTQCYCRKYGYNLKPTAGSSLGTKQSKETIEKKRQNTSIGPIYQYTKDLKFVKEWKNLISITDFDTNNNRYKRNCIWSVLRGHNNTYKGFVWSLSKNINSHNYKIIHKSTGRKWSDERREMMVEIHKNREISKEQIERIIKSGKDKSKPILQFDLQGNFIREYCSIREAGRETTFDSSLLAKVCKGRYKNMYGFIWKYKNS